jgi:multicomponent Na+:H+ antiporter subunit B
MDVSFTEAAVGAGISTVLLIGALAHTGSDEKVPARMNWTAVAIVGLTTAALVYGTLDMPRFGDPNAPVHVHPVSIGYIRQDVDKVPDPWGHYANYKHHDEDYFHGHVPNYVTAVIVAYRGYDTMYETTVILIAGMTMVLLLRRRRKESP